MAGFGRKPTAVSLGFYFSLKKAENTNIKRLFCALYMIFSLKELHLMQQQSQCFTALWPLDGSNAQQSLLTCRDEAELLSVHFSDGSSVCLT